MFFSKKKPEAPPITDEAKYVAWFVEYSDELDYIRQLLGKKAFVEPSIREALRELSNFPNPDALFDRLTGLATSYQTKLKPLIDARGGLHRCPPQILAAAANIMLNMAVIKEMLTKKYRHRNTIDLLNVINGKS
jgi:hypothetical protein